MAGFSADWLAVREPADRSARAHGVARFVAEAVRSHRHLRVLDLGAGTGSNLRALVEHLPRAQSWRLVDHDRQLLADIPRRMRAWEADAHESGDVARRVVTQDGGAMTLHVGDRVCRVSAEERDLRALDVSLFKGVHLVTAAALLDLASDSWIETLVARCAAARASALFVLSYDGRVECSPHEPEDAAMVALVNRHQRIDKGFGPAAGPTATDVAARHFAGTGYGVRRATSDWILGPEAPELQRQLVVGWAEAATDIDPPQAAVIHDWLTRRLAHVETGASRIRVGHEDLGCVPR